MLAIKLHKKPVPFLGVGSHLVPIMSWLTGERFVRNWVPMLNRQNRHRPNNQIHYITLVRIPDSTQLHLNTDWCSFNDDYQSFASLQQEGSHEITERKILKKDEHGATVGVEWVKDPWFIAGKEWYAQWFDPDLENYRDTKEPIGMRGCLPEIILGEKLPNRCVLWTKDFRLLCHGDKKSREISRKAKHRKGWQANQENQN
jgi:hypothetical protein